MKSILNVLIIIIVSLLLLMFSGCSDNKKTNSTQNNSNNQESSNNDDPINLNINASKTDSNSNNTENHSNPYNNDRNNSVNSSNNNSENQRIDSTNNNNNSTSNNSVIECSETGKVFGVICGVDDGFPGWVSNARVYFDAMNCSGEMTHYETTTDRQGTFTFENVPNGTHTINAERGLFETTRVAQVFPGQITDISGTDLKLCKGALGSIAVIVGGYDKVEQILADLDFSLTLIGYDPLFYNLDDMGDFDWNNYNNSSNDELDEHYTVSQISVEDFLTDFNKMSEFDSIFLNCGIFKDYYSFQEYEFNTFSTMSTVQTNLRNFVENGGSLYASDWSYDYIKNVFPAEIINFPSNMRGDIQTITGQVLPEGLVDYLEGINNVSISFDLSEWIIMDRVDDQTEILVSGSPATTTGGTANNVPLMVLRKFGQGKFVYTSFHNEQQVSEDMVKLLKYLIWQMVVPQM